MIIDIKIEGVSPLIMNRFFDEAANETMTGMRSSANGRERGTPREQAERKIYFGADEKTIIIPSPNLLRCFYDGGSFHKIGKKQVTTKRESLLCSCVFIDETELKLSSKEGWRVDTRAVVIPSTQGRIMTHRPMFDDWSIDLSISLDERIIGSKLLRQIIDDAGSRIGIGDFRPARKGPYGRFCVSNWTPIC